MKVKKKILYDAINKLFEDISEMNTFTNGKIRVTLSTDGLNLYIDNPTTEVIDIGRFKATLKSVFNNIEFSRPGIENLAPEEVEIVTLKNPIESSEIEQIILSESVHSGFKFSTLLKK